MRNSINRGTKILLILTSALVSASTAHAQCDPRTLFGPRQDFAVGDSPRSVAIGDFNGDGVPDLAAANFSSDTVSVLLGNGDGTFQPRQDFATGSNPWSLAIADLDGDGVPDLAVANSTSNTVSVLLGDGDGTLQPRQDFATGSNPWSLAIADLDGDGVSDLAVANEGSNTVSVLLGNGDGTLQPRQDLVSGSNPGFVAIDDLNGDGVPDLAVANRLGGSISVLLGNGDGTFQPPGLTIPFRTETTIDYLVIGDLNGDGIPDLAVASRGEPSIAVLIGLGDGDFLVLEPFDAGPSGSLSIAAGDVNFDGVLDLVSSRDAPFSTVVRVFLGNGDGTFQPRREFTTGTFPRSVAIGDLDGDGLPDLTVANSGSDTVSVLLNQCPPPLPAIASQPASVLAGPAPAPVTFSVGVQSGGVVSYQWTRDDQPIDDGPGISGARSPELTILASGSSVAEYRCVVSNIGGSVTSMPAILGFRPNPCAADLDGNGVVGFDDLLSLLAAWGSCV